MATNQNHIIQSLWVGGALSKVEQLCIKSFLDHGHEFHLYAYHQLENVPQGTCVIDANVILPIQQVFQNKNTGWGQGSYTGFADIFRIMLIKKNGGWWVDMDVICLKAFDLQPETVFSSSYEHEYGQLANNCVFKAPPDSPFLVYCANVINKAEASSTNFGEIGVLLFQNAIKSLHLESAVVPYTYFNPIGWRSTADLILGEAPAINRLKEIIRPLLKPDTMHGRRISSGSYAVHFWNEVWRNNNFSKNGQYSSHSLFEKLKYKHGIF